MVHKIAFISITILALLTILNASGIIYLGGDAKALDYGDFYRYGSSVGAVGFTGVYLSIGIIVGLSFIHYAVLSRHWIMLIIPMLCLIFYAFVLTSLLSGVISLSIALAIILLRQRVWSAKGIMVASIIIAVFFLSWLLVPVIKERATEQLIRTQSQPTERWASSRVGIFESAFRIFMRHPITGVGLGNVDELIPLYWDLPWVNRRGVHSLYLQMLTEAGIFCLLFFGLIILKCLQKLKDVIIYSKIIPEQFAAIVTIGVLIVILINGLAHTLSRMHYMWVYIGLALSFSDKTRASHKVSYSHSVKERH
jgi:O-antigen ligase